VTLIGSQHKCLICKQKMPDGYRDYTFADVEVRPDKWLCGVVHASCKLRANERGDERVGVW
jgi:hypothetical protein